MVAFQSTSSSGVVPEQSVKSGNVDGRSNIVLVSGAPAPVAPWQPAHPDWKIASPDVSPLAVGGFVCADAAAATASVQQRWMMNVRSRTNV
jgi:hypothetical protein